MAMVNLSRYVVLIVLVLGDVAYVRASSHTTGWPNASNTGYTHAPGYPGSLTPWGGGTIESNTTYSFIDFGQLSVGTLANPVSNVTFIGCRFKATAVEDALVVLFGDNITFSYCSFEPGVSAPPTPYNQSYQYGIEADGGFNSFVQQLTVEYSDFWGFGNAIDIIGSTQAKPQVFRHNWIHDAADDGGSYHTDGIGTLSGTGTGSYVVIHHNTIESLGNTNGIAFQEGTYSHFTITNNLFGGFGYTVALWAAAGSGSFTTFTDNTFSTFLPVSFGPLYPEEFWNATGSVWLRNRWQVPSGAAWGTPSHDGWCWIPVAEDSPNNDSPFVSENDASCAGVTFLSEPTGLSLSGSTTPAFLSEPTGVGISGSTTPAFLSEPTGVGISGSTTPTFPGEPTGLALSQP